MEPYVSFISNAFMEVDMTCIAEQLSATFSLGAGEGEMEIVTLQSVTISIHLKAHQGSPNVWCPVDTKVQKRHKGVCTA